MKAVSMENENPDLKAIVRKLVEHLEPAYIYLFGSKARGDDGPDSDYDLLVIVPESDEPGYLRAKRAQEILWGIWTAADVIVLTVEEFESRKASPCDLPAVALEEGKLLYAA